VGKNPASRTLSLGRASQHQRHFQQHGGHESLPRDLRAPHRRIPEIPQKSGINRWCSLWRWSASVCKVVRTASLMIDSIWNVQRRLLAREKPRIQAAPTTQRIVVYRPMAEQSPRRRFAEFDIGVIVILEQIDVRHLLLADSRRSNSGAPRSSFPISIS